MVEGRTIKHHTEEQLSEDREKPARRPRAGPR